MHPRNIIPAQYTDTVLLISLIVAHRASRRTHSCHLAVLQAALRQALP
jgi:hypothetical protein